MSKSNARALILLLFLTIVATSRNLPGQTGAKYQDAAVSSSDVASAETTLDGLKVSEPGSMSGYSREKFPHWSKASKFGWSPPLPSCDSREAALIRDGKDVKVGSECKVESGTWLDPYTD